jgi:caffeoyl-CoA O-methyltransferase
MENLDDFIDEKITGLDPYLDHVERQTHLHMLQSHMLSGKLQAGFLKMIVTLMKPNRILELGTYTGYATLAMAEGLPLEGRITTIECESEVAERAMNHFAKSTHSNKIDLILGEAKDTVEELFKDTIYDLIFIDADKKSNQYYYDLILASHPAGTLILIDNVLWKGKVLDANINDSKTKAIKEFIQYVSNDDRVESLILPIRDGLYMVRIKE